MSFAPCIHLPYGFAIGHSKMKTWQSFSPFLTAASTRSMSTFERSPKAFRTSPISFTLPSASADFAVPLSLDLASCAELSLTPSSLSAASDDWILKYCSSSPLSASFFSSFLSSAEAIEAPPASARAASAARNSRLVIMLSSVEGDGPARVAPTRKFAVAPLAVTACDRTLVTVTSEVTLRSGREPWFAMGEHEFARKSPGRRRPHADAEALLASPAREVRGHHCRVVKRRFGCVRAGRARRRRDRHQD